VKIARGFDPRRLTDWERTPCSSACLADFEPRSILRSFLQPPKYSTFPFLFEVFLTLHILPLVRRSQKGTTEEGAGMQVALVPHNILDKEHFPPFPMTDNPAHHNLYMTL
jgi:hypothetical protein